VDQTYDASALLSSSVGASIAGRVRLLEKCCLLRRDILKELDLRP
jgi:hypothetical protein